MVSKGIKFKSLELEKKKKKVSPKKNIIGNFRGKEDLFFKKVRDGLIKFLESPYK